MKSSYYDTAKICLNGHVVNASSIRLPQYNAAYCEKCGSQTITECPECSAPIRGTGWMRIPGVAFPAPAFCIHCGQPFPWTAARLEAAQQLAQELELDSAQRQALSDALPDLVKDTPQTPEAVRRFQRLMSQVGQNAALAFREILISVVTEEVRKMIWPS